jgi:hypothetical protein
MNKKLLGAIEEAIKGLNMVAEAIKAEGADADENSAPAKRTPAGRKASEKKAPAKSAPAKKTADEDEDDSAGEYTYEELMDMPYNDMKKYAKSVGVTAMGSREKIVNDILKTYGVEAPDEEDEDEDEAPKKKAPASKKAPAGKKTPASKKSAPVEEEDEEDEEEDEVTAQVNEAVKDMEDSEIAELLKQAGLPSKGKRTALIARVIKGVKDEVIDLDGEEDEDEDEESIYDSLNDYENNEEIPEERAAAIKKFEAATNKKVKAKTLKMAMIKKALTSYYGDEADLSEAGDEELVEAYIDMKCRFIDDEGDNYDGTDDAYYVNGMLACHGYICEESEDGSSLVCPVCGAEYENEAE